MKSPAPFANRSLAFLLAAPQLLIAALFFYWPLGTALRWSLSLERPWGGHTYAGFSNFVFLLSDDRMLRSVGVSVIFAVCSTALSLLVAVLLALAVDRRLRGHRWFQAGLILPFAVAGPAAGFAFRFLLAPDVGLAAGLNHLVPGLWAPNLNGGQALLMLVLCQSWKTIAFDVLFLVAGLQALPRTLDEAATLDGAGEFQRMRDIRLPLLSPTLFFLLLANMSDAFTGSFGIVDVLTEGGPAGATRLLVYKLFTDGFRGQDFSAAAAGSVVLMVTVAILMVLQFRFVDRKIHYR